ncbi:ATP-dependent Clp protease proteolytic subunit [Iris pallida]|uniref:ATP-dependent Clp protease proteolytic subunit n=1 Tax=Iris pallida TaxID=29817 RepID=A0AAX6DVB9_IRIPA|nr:ATP-dependent Clp protease proteolytic subunit [Iris pallida]
MVYLSIEDDTKDLYLFINSSGGWVIPGIANYDTMQFVSPNVHTICMELAASMGSFILVGGEITKQVSLLIFMVMIYQPASSFYEAQAGEFILEAEKTTETSRNLTKVYVQRTGNPLWIISEDMERDVFMSTTEAQAHSIVDLVAVENENTGNFV